MLFGKRDIKCKKDEASSIYSHGVTYLLQFNSIEECLYIFNTVDGYPYFTYFPFGQCMIAVVANLSRKIEGYTQTHYTLR